MKCFNCQEECAQIWQVRVVHDDGSTTYEKTCCEDCAEEVRQKYLEIHERRAESVRRQSFQRFR